MREINLSLVSQEGLYSKRRFSSASLVIFPCFGGKYHLLTKLFYSIEQNKTFLLSCTCKNLVLIYTQMKRKHYISHIWLILEEKLKPVLFLLNFYSIANRFIIWYPFLDEILVFLFLVTFWHYVSELSGLKMK